MKYHFPNPSSQAIDNRNYLINLSDLTFLQKISPISVETGDAIYMFVFGSFPCVFTAE